MQPTPPTQPLPEHRPRTSFEPTEDSGRVDVRITAVDWDATDEMLSQQAFVVPEDLQGGGHFVLTQRAGDVQEGIWLRAS